MILKLSDIRDKQRELEFYQARMTELERNLMWIETEIDLTNRILKMIKSEQVQIINETSKG